MDPAAILNKPYARMILREEDGSYSAEIVEFPGCLAVGATADEALSQLDEVAMDWIATALRQGQSIPEPMEVSDYSGKLVVRMSKSLHQRAALYADREGVSLNQFIVTAVAEQVGTRSISTGSPSWFSAQFVTNNLTNLHLTWNAGPMASVKHVGTSVGKTLGLQIETREATHAGS